LRGRVAVERDQRRTGPLDRYGERGIVRSWTWGSESKMLGGASQTVSKIRVKCNGT
jgi:hypothetical protein